MLTENSNNLEVRFAGPEDAGAICQLFSKVFREEMSLDHWHWKYDREQSKAVVVLRDGKLVGHYGGVGTQINLKGNSSTAIQITDLMVDPEARHGVRSKSPFNLSAQMFLETLVGYDKPFLLAYGFPSERAMGLSEKLGFFASSGKMLELEWAVENKVVPGFRKTILVTEENFAEYTGAINRVWNAFSKQFSDKILCHKDAAYFLWRYIQHPSKNYSIHLVPGLFGKSPKALFVLRHDAHNSMLMDILCAPSRFTSVITTAIAETLKQGNDKLLTWCSEGFQAYFEEHKPVIKPLPITIPACTHTHGPDVEAQKGRWWFMPGDTDYL